MSKDFRGVCLFCFSIIATSFLVNKGEYIKYLEWDLYRPYIGLSVRFSLADLLSKFVV